jgi:hypothetical protein
MSDDAQTIGVDDVTAAVVLRDLKGVMAWLAVSAVVLVLFLTVHFDPGTMHPGMYLAVVLSLLSAAFVALRTYWHLARGGSDG